MKNFNLKLILKLMLSKSNHFYCVRASLGEPYQLPLYATVMVKAVTLDIVTEPR